MTTDATLNDVVLSAAVPTAAVLKVSRGLVGGRRHVAVDIPGRAGAWVFEEEPGDRYISLVVDLQASTFALRRAAVRSLADWADVGAVAQLILDDETDRFYNVILDGDPELDEHLNNAGVELRFRSAPYAEAVSISTSSPSATASGGSSGTFTAADTITALPIVEVQANGGNVTVLTFTLNGDTIIAGPISSGASIAISSISSTVTTGPNTDTELTGAYDTAEVVMSGVSGAFPFIDPGSNAWSASWTGTATSLTITISWRRRYR